MKEKIKLIQKKVGTTPDGIVGPKTVAAIMAALDIQEPAPPSTWPTQAEVRSGKSVFGAPGEHDLVKVIPPYRLYFDGKPLNFIRVHKAVAEAVTNALHEVYQAYGPERIHALGLDVYDGSYVYKNTTGGKSLSMHAWGIALDFDAAHNAYGMHAPAARFSGPEYAAWWAAWERQGAVSLGRERDYDYMHIQFARLG